jgi:hypothetical protein
MTDHDYKQQLETYLRALVPLEECLKMPVTNSSLNEQSSGQHHHRQNNSGTRGRTGMLRMRMNH